MALLGYFIGINLTGDVERRTLAALVDPFGVMAVDSVTHYWSIAEKNTRLVGLQGDFLWNRLLWTGMALAILGFTYVRFSFTSRSEPARRRAEEERPSAHRRRRSPPARLDFSPRASLGVFGSMFALQLRETVKSVFFGVIVLAGVLFIASTAPNIGRLYGTPTYPVTSQVVSIVGGSFCHLHAGGPHHLRRGAGVARARRGDGPDPRRAALPALDGGGGQGERPGGASRRCCWRW